MNEGHGVISHVQTDFADRHDSLLMPRIVGPLYQRLLAHDLPVVDVGADTNYSNGQKYALPEAQPPTWIPVFGHYKPGIEGFTYDKATDCFACPAGKPLPYKRFDSDQDGQLSKRNSAATSDCRRCLR